MTNIRQRLIQHASSIQGILHDMDDDQEVDYSSVAQDAVCDARDKLIEAVANIDYVEVQNAVYNPHSKR